MSLQDAFVLFQRLGVDVRSLSAPEFKAAYIELVKRYHPDIGCDRSAPLMAGINAARTTILQTYRHEDALPRAARRHSG